MKRREFLKGAALTTLAGIWGINPSNIIKAPTQSTDEQKAETMAEVSEDIYDDYLSHPYFLEGGWKLPSQIILTYTLVDVNTSIPITGEGIYFTTNFDGTGVVWAGTTDEFGKARDIFGLSPYLETGKYYVWRKHGDDPAIFIDVVFNY